MSTFYSLHYHLVFSTKYRKPWIKSSWMARMHEYLGGTLNGMNVKPLKVGGVEDHVHLLIGMKPTHRICDVVRELKKSASEWVHSEIQCSPFQWQEGYSIFAVSPDARGQVSEYINNQARHHRTRTFREELIELLDKAGVQYDPTYLD